jgi:hypothetical protein
MRLGYDSPVYGKNRKARGGPEEFDRGAGEVSNRIWIIRSPFGE